MPKLIGPSANHPIHHGNELLGGDRSSPLSKALNLSSDALLSALGRKDINRVFARAGTFPLHELPPDKIKSLGLGAIPSPKLVPLAMSANDPIVNDFYHT